MLQVHNRVKLYTNDHVNYGEVMDLPDGKVTVRLSNGDEANTEVIIDKIDLISRRPFDTDADILKAFCQYEISGEEAMRYIKGNHQEQVFQINMDDIGRAFANFSLSGASLDTFAAHWLDPLEYEMSTLVGFDKILAGDESVSTIEAELINDVMSELHVIIDEGIHDYTIPDLANKLYYWELVPAESLKSKIEQNLASEIEYRLYEKLIQRLCEKGHIGTLEMRGEQALEHKEWKTALEYYSKLYKRNGDPAYAENSGLCICTCVLITAFLIMITHSDISRSPQMMKS